MNIGFIDYYLDEWHANNYPRFIDEASNGEMKVTLAYGHIDSPHGGRTTEQWCRDMNIPRAATIDEVCEKCDAIIVLSPDNSEMHELLCQKPLSTGKRVYVDKTFAPDYETAKRIFDVADKHNTPCYSTSALRFEESYQNIKDADAIASWGPNGFETYAIHQLEPIMMMIDAQPKKVCYTPGKGCYTLTIVFEDGRTATVSGFEAESPFMMNVIKDSESRVLEANSDYFHGFIVNLVNFFKTGEGAVSHEETLRIMAALGAGRKASENPGQWINI